MPPAIQETNIRWRQEHKLSVFLGQPREVAELIAFLADRSKSSYIVSHVRTALLSSQIQIGQCMGIDGGASLYIPMFQSLTELDK